MKSFLILLCLLIAGCSTYPLKAPCNEKATFCGTKTKINSW